VTAGTRGRGAVRHDGGVLTSVRVKRWLVVAWLVAGCGRYQFNPADPGADAAPDGSSAPQPIHRYRLAGSYADDHGGPPLTGQGGRFDGAGGYRFAANQGLVVSDALSLATYTIEVTFAFDNVPAAMYQKLIDFKELSTDEGLYVYGESLDFVVDAATKTEAISQGLFSAGTMTRVTLARGTDGAVTGYVDGAAAIAFRDPGAIAEFTHQGRIANFGIDDRATTQREAGAGIIREIAIWDIALSAAQVAALP
jgi:hypothetical protein